MCKKKPVDKNKVTEEFKKKYTQNIQQSPLANAMWLSHIMYNFVAPIISVSTKTEFLQDMHYELREKDKIKNVVSDFENNWSSQLAYADDQIRSSYFSLKKPNFIMKTIWRTYWKQFLVCLFMSIVFSTMQYVNTYILYKSLNAIKTHPDTEAIIIDWSQIGILLVTLIASKIV